jgi:hypothetical protein
MAVATAMPRPKTESKIADNQRLKVLDDFWNHSKVTRLWDDAVPKLGQITAPKNLSSRTNGLCPISRARVRAEMCARNGPIGQSNRCLSPTGRLLPSHRSNLLFPRPGWPQNRFDALSRGPKTAAEGSKRFSGLVAGSIDGKQPRKITGA